jgi:hypothetical protein
MVKKQEVKNYTVQEFYNRILYKLMQSIGIKHDQPRSIIQEKMYIIYKLGFENFGDWHNFSGSIASKGLNEWLIEYLEHTDYLECDYSDLKFKRNVTSVINKFNYLMEAQPKTMYDNMWVELLCQILWYNGTKELLALNKDISKHKKVIPPYMRYYASEIATAENTLKEWNLL